MYYNRQICAAKYSVVKTYRHSAHMVLTGCTSMPGKGSKFCSDHKVAYSIQFNCMFDCVIKDEDTPCHLSSELSKETVRTLTGTQPQEFAKVLDQLNGPGMISIIGQYICC